MTLQQASAKQWVKQAEKKILKFSQTLHVINQQLWCCRGGAGIAIFDSELQRLHTIPSGGMGRVCDVAETTNGDVIIAATKWLYHIRNGECC